jgi:molecular chaperone HtpG
MTITLASAAEVSASKAEELTAFSGIKLLKVKQELALLLELIGREEIFSEYTRHDISHIDRMLDWLIPDSTKSILTPADWLTTVLSIYFHDLGMLVTRNEYAARHSSGFPAYRDNVLFAGDKGADYRAKVAEMGEDAGERFLYQEFVRSAHAERIRAWITGVSRERLGISSDVVAVINDMLGALDDGFREDLAIVCESHHLEDLTNFKKYKTRRPYGNSEAETVNLQYAAVLMRTADLLHITKDRTPTTSFRVINPADPISQEEWSKQMAVTSVRAQLGRDRDGNFDDNAPRDTIEIFARFTRREGFFALTSYLIYAGNEIRRSYEAVRLASKTQGAHHQFPWRKVDDANVETKGFLRETFGFTLDQPRILKLLTGHTLYNDTNVVLRELIQNSLDAVRLQRLINEQSLSSTTESGKIEITYDSKNRILSVQDNGTGMSQEIIEKNLLTVGASRYEDPEFRKTFPSFSAISRFGIGILSTFMIADVVEILTCSPADNEARQLSLRSVLGRYLIRLIDKEKDDDAKPLMPHGTIVRLKIRPSAEAPDVLKISRSWILIPDCDVLVKIDDGDPVKIGYASPKAALEKALGNAGLVTADGNQIGKRRIAVIEKEKKGVTLAYALEWSEFFHEWSFLDVSILRDAREEVLGTCVEGVRVEFDSPGFEGKKIVALANARGGNAPKTNVARSGFELTPEREAMLEAVYSIYCDHVKSEIEALRTERSYSLTWALQESKYILDSLIIGGHHPDEARERYEPLSRRILFEKIRDLPILLGEQNGTRQAVSATYVRDQPAFWTSSGPYFRSAEFLIREIPGEVSLSAFANFFKIDLGIPFELLLCGVSPTNTFDSLAFAGKEIDKIIVSKQERRASFRWTETSIPSRWRSFPRGVEYPQEIYGVIAEYGRYSHMGQSIYEKLANIFVGRTNIDIEGVDNESAIAVHYQTYIFYGSPAAKLINEAFDQWEITRAHVDLVTISLYLALVSLLESGRTDRLSDDQITKYVRAIREVDVGQKIDYSALQVALISEYREYDPLAWSRR